MKDGDAHAFAANLAFVGIEGDNHAEAVALELGGVTEEGLAEVADADEGEADGAVGAQDRLDARAEFLDVIAQARHAELAEWWVRMETVKDKTKGDGWRFRDNRTFASIVEAARQGLLFDDGPDDEIPCACAAGPADWRDEDDD